MTNSVTPILWLMLSGGLVITLMFYYSVIENKIYIISDRIFRSPIVIRYFFFPGTMIHELSHAFACILLGVKVYKIVLFQPKKDELTGNYRLGYVEHSKVDPFRSTLVGIAPVIGCALATYLAFVWANQNITISQTLSMNAFANAFKWGALGLLNYKTYIFIYLAVSCALAGEPSNEDMKSIPMLIFILSILGLIIFLTKNSSFWPVLTNYIITFTKFIAPVFQGITIFMLFELIILFIIHLIALFVFRAR